MDAQTGKDSAGPRVVLVHDWLTGMRGGEKCLEVLCRRWPQAQLFTLLHRRGSVSAAIEQLGPRTSFLQLLPGVQHYYRYLLPLMPAAARRWRLPPCDLVVSFSHCIAKAARPPERDTEGGEAVPERVPHVCYCFTPMRYAWHMRASYFEGRVRGLKARLLERFLGRLRAWDRRTAEGVSHFLAISATVQRRIAECYGRDSTILYPPVDTDFYSPAPFPRRGYYLALSAFAPYKRLDLAIAACNRLRRPLVVIGNGQDEGRLRSLAGPTVNILGWQSDVVIRDHLRRCQALLFPGEEDFGIVPVEAQACGTPVIAFARGGATETVIPLRIADYGLRIAEGNPQSAIRNPQSAEPTGLFFEEQTVDCLVEALRTFETHLGDFSPAVARRQAQRFNKQRFAEELFAYLDEVLRSSGRPARRAA